MWIFALTLMLIYLGAVYFDHHSGWFDAKVYSPYGSAEELEAYQPKSGAAAMLARGKQVYEQVCGLCHGVDGARQTRSSPAAGRFGICHAKGMQRLVHIPLTGVAATSKLPAKTGTCLWPRWVRRYPIPISPRC